VSESWGRGEDQDFGRFFAEIARSLDESRKQALAGNPYASDKWDNLVQAWRELHTQTLSTLWEYASVASVVQDEFNSDAIGWFAREVRYPQHMIQRAAVNNAIDKVVISDSLTSEETAPWHNTYIIRRAEAHAQIAELKGQPGKDILVFGSHTLWRDLLAHDLVDELHLMIGPVVLGAGTPVFDGPPKASLLLIDTAHGMAQVTYSYSTKSTANSREPTGRRRPISP
jgi:dihydrofolate reductase